MFRNTTNIILAGAFLCGQLQPSVAGGLTAEAVLGDHLPREPRGLPEVRARAGGHLGLAEDELLSETSTKGDSQLGLEVLLRVHSRLEALLLGGEEGEDTGDRASLTRTTLSNGVGSWPIAGLDEAL